MKIIDDDGNVMQELSGDDAFVVFHPNGEIGFWCPTMEGDDVEVPEYILAATGTFVYANDEGLKAMADYFRSKRVS